MARHRNRRKDDDSYFCSSRFDNSTGTSPNFEPQSEHPGGYRQYQENRRNWPQKQQQSKRRKQRRASSFDSDSDSDSGLRDPQVQFLASQKQQLRLQNYDHNMAKTQSKPNKKKSAGTGKGGKTIRESPRLSKKRRHEDEESEGGEDLDSEEEVAETPKQAKGKSNKSNGKRVSPDSQVQDDDDGLDDEYDESDESSDEEDDDATVDMREQERPKKKPKKNKNSSNDPKDSGKDPKDSAKDLKDSKKEAPEVVIARLQKQLEMSKKTKKKGLPSANATKNLDAPQREIVKKTKTHIFQRCKFIKGQQYMSKATALAMEMCNPIEFAGLDDKKLAQKQEEWMAEGGGNENLVRTSINEHRSYVNNEVRDFYTTAFKKNKDAEFPNKAQILDLAMRRGMEEGDDTRDLYLGYMVTYVDILLVKVVGVTYWPPSARYKLLPSSATSKDRQSKDPDSQLMKGPLVHPSGEAFLVWTLENAYDRWFHTFKIKRAKAGGMVGADLTKLMEDTKGEMETKFSEAKGGQTKFGGVNKAGWKRYEDLVKMIKKNRVDNKESIKKVEEEVLELVRKKHNRDAIEAKQKDKKPKGEPKIAPPVENDPNFKADDPDQWF